MNSDRWVSPKLGSPTSRWRSVDFTAWVLLAPALLIFSLLVLYPIGRTVWLSFWDWNGITVGTWAGFSNYGQVLTDEKVHSAFMHSLVFLVFYTILPIAIGLLITLVIVRSRIRGEMLFRSVLFLPQILSTVVIAVAWRWIYAPDGPLNGLLNVMGVGFLSRAWLGDFDTALPALGLIGTWIVYGFCMVLFIAGAQKIPRDRFEAARIDGAGPIAELRHILVPGLRREMTVVLIFTVTLALRNFDIVWNTTQGGPGSTTTVPSLFIYQETFVYREVGIGATLSVLLTLLILIVTGFLLWRRSAKDAE